MYNNDILLFSKEKKYQQEEDVLTMDPTQDKVKLVVYNDDYNTFDWVIESFVKVCKHSTEQAEQLSYIVHFKGKAVVKQGTKKEMKPLKEALVDRGLSAVIED